MTVGSVFLLRIPRCAQTADELGTGSIPRRSLAAVVEESGHVETHAGVALQPARQLKLLGL